MTNDFFFAYSLFPKFNLIMENTGWLDLLIGAVAITILVGGLILLFKGISSMQK
ncbi:hypothetical protein ACP6PL_11205 [Dapis sp. BLCC M126]